MEISFFFRIGPGPWAGPGGGPGGGGSQRLALRTGRQPAGKTAGPPVSQPLAQPIGPETSRTTGLAARGLGRISQGFRINFPAGDFPMQLRKIRGLFPGNSPANVWEILGYTRASPWEIFGNPCQEICGIFPGLCRESPGMSVGKPWGTAENLLVHSPEIHARTL